MKLSESIKPISYLKSNAAEIIRNISDNQNTLIITQNGEAKAVVQSIKEYEQQQETLALLKILAQSNSNISNGNTKPIEKSFDDLRKRIEGSKSE